MRVLIASDKFKGSLSGVEACEAIEAGLKAALGRKLCEETLSSHRRSASVGNIHSEGEPIQAHAEVRDQQQYLRCGASPRLEQSRLGLFDRTSLCSLHI